LLDKSKIEAGKLSLETINVDLRHMLRKLDRLWRPSIEKKGLLFSLQISDDVPAVIQGDSIRIRQILSNLLSNATKFTETGSIILKVEARPVSQSRVRIEFQVQDTGVGMDESMQSRLFRAYEQASNATGRQYGGTGLGLAISKDLATLMQGDIEVESKLGLGSKFRFYADFESTGMVSEKTPVSQIPANPVVPAMVAPVAPMAQSLDPKPSDEDSLRILAVEDNPINQRVLAAFLRPIGCDVVWAGNGQEALDFLDNEHFDVVLMDIQMPVMDGLEATKALRAGSSRNVNVPVIAMTANAMLGDRETCLSAGMHDYVSKPIDPKVLYKSISHLVELSRAGTLESKAVATGI
jgi:CheY-like chemotaxis protein